MKAETYRARTYDLGGSGSDVAHHSLFPGVDQCGSIMRTWRPRSVRREAGPVNLKKGGSGFRSFENDDPSAEVGAKCLENAGVHQSDVTAWNAYPWFLPDQSGVTASRIDEGIGPLGLLLDLLPEARSLVACGQVAQESWRRFARQNRRSAAGLANFETFHTSGRGITNGERLKKADGINHVVATLRAAAGAER